MVLSQPLNSSKVNEQTVTVPDGHHLLIVKISNHTFTSVLAGEREIARSRTAVPSIGLSIQPGTYKVRSDGTIESVTSDVMENASLLSGLASQGKPACLQVTSDATDRNVVDGVGEIPADGASFVIITLRKVDMSGRPLKGAEDNDEVFLRTTGGLLMDEKGQNRVRFLRLVNGQVAFRLVSEKSPKIVTVSVFAQTPGPAPSQIQIEFV